MLHERAEVGGLAARHREQHAPAGGENATELPERAGAPGGVGVGPEPVGAVVQPDVLERRDAEDDVEGAALERELADVGRDGVQAGHVGRGQIDADELRRAQPDQLREVRRLREGVADVEHTRLAAISGKHPGDLDRPLVRARRGGELARALVREAGLAGPGERVVERAHQNELVTRGELVQERRARQRPSLERRYTSLQVLRQRVASQEQPVRVRDVVPAAQ